MHCLAPLSGNYTVTAQAAGFKKSVRNAIDLRINDRVAVDFELQIGQAAESVDVHAETPYSQETRSC